ncbi:integrase, catalytic region, zinc finger, CCHC-type containing protein [Tanacetum coccineum]
MISTVKLPILKKGEYTLWSMRIEQYLTNTDYGLWQKPRQSYDRFQKLISQLEVHGATISNEDANQKFLRAPPSSWNNIALIMRNKEASFHLPLLDDLMFLFFANQSNSPQLDDEDLEQIDHEDLEEMNLKWECRAPRNQGNKNRDAGYRSRDNTRRTVPIETSDALVVQDNALIMQDGLGYDWSYIAQDKPTEFALMAYTSRSDTEKNEAVYEEKITVLEFEVKDKGYGDQLNKNDSSGSKLFNSVLDSRSSDGNDNQTNDRFKKDNEYHAVPPPLTGNYMPPLADLSFARLDDFVYRPTANKTSASVPSGVIIKDWGSDDDEDIFQSNDVQITVKPSFKRIEFTKARNEPVKSDKHAIKPRMVTQSPKRMPRESVLGKDTGHREVRPIYNNTQRINHQNKFVPTAVLTRSERIPVSTAKQHMTGNKDFLTDYQKLDGGFVAFGGSARGEGIHDDQLLNTAGLSFLYLKKLPRPRQCVAGYGGAQNRVGNANPGPTRQVKCYNYNSIGHIARNCTQPKRPQNSKYFKDKMLLMQAQENRVALDEEQLLFIASGQDSAIDEDVMMQLLGLSTHVGKCVSSDSANAFDSDVDEAPTTQTMFMANLSSADPVYDEAGPYYNLDILSEVHDHDHYQDVVCEHHKEHEIHDDVQPTYVVDSHANYTTDSNIIPYDQYVKDNKVPVVQIVDNSLTIELATYKEQVELYERRARFELREREQKIDEQLRIVIIDRNIKKENLKKELHSIKMKLASTINHNKSMVEEKNPLCLIRTKKVQPALYNGYEIIKNNHVPTLVHNTEDTPEIAEITRRKMNEKMKDTECVTHKVKITPPDYSKENYLATFTSQKQLTPEQIFWSQDLTKMKEEALKKQTTASRPIKALTVYPPNTPATLVPRVLPTKSQVKINIFALIQLFSEFEKICKKRITPTGLTKRERGFEQTKECYLTEVIPFFKTLKEHFEGIQKALTKEMKDIFEELEAEVDQNVVNRKHDEIEQKNLLIANDNLIADCLSKEVFYIATNSELTVSRFTEMHKAHTIVQTRCLELESELSKLRDKVKKVDHTKLVKCFSNLEVNHLNLQLKYQTLKKVLEMTHLHPLEILLILTQSL